MTKPQMVAFFSLPPEGWRGSLLCLGAGCCRSLSGWGGIGGVFLFFPEPPGMIVKDLALLDLANKSELAACELLSAHSRVFLV